MKYPELIEPCKSCGGCMRLESTDFVCDKNCEYRVTAEECIKEIKLDLGVEK